MPRPGSTPRWSRLSRRARRPSSESGLTWTCSWGRSPSLADVPPENPVVTEEQVGPVLPYEGLDEAVEGADDTGFGLGGSVWGTDLDRAEPVAHRLECGTA